MEGKHGVPIRDLNYSFLISSISIGPHCHPHVCRVMVLQDLDAPEKRPLLLD